MLVVLDYQHFDFEDGFSLDMKPLNVADFQKILSHMKGFNFRGDSDDMDMAISMGFEQLADANLAKLSKEIIPAYCQSLKGIQAQENGVVRDCVVDDLTNQGAFLPVCLKIIMKLFTISSLTEQEIEDVKKP